jgi:hypothetical protein
MELQALALSSACSTADGITMRAKTSAHADISVKNLSASAADQAAREQDGRRAAQPADSDNEAQRKTRARANRRALSAAETIAASIAAAQRPLKRFGSVAEGLLFKAAANAHAANAAGNVPGIPPFRGNQVVNSLPGFLNLPIKHNARSLAHACGFPSLSLFG